MLKRFALCVLLTCGLLGQTLCLAQEAGGQTGDGWSAVGALPRGDQLEVKYKNGRSVKGVFDRADDTQLVILREGREVAVARADVRRVYHLLGKAQKAKYAAIGAGLGLGAGAGIGAAQARGTSDDGGTYYIVAIPIAAGVGAVVGTFVGMARRKRALVYEAR